MICHLRLKLYFSPLKHLSPIPLKHKQNKNAKKKLRKYEKLCGKFLDIATGVWHADDSMLWFFFQVIIFNGTIGYKRWMPTVERGNIEMKIFISTNTEKYFSIHVKSNVYTPSKIFLFEKYSYYTNWISEMDSSFFRLVHWFVCSFSSLFLRFVGVSKSFYDYWN